MESSYEEDEDELNVCLNDYRNSSFESSGNLLALQSWIVLQTKITSKVSKGDKVALAKVHELQLLFY